MHQTFGGGGMICHDPAERGLVLRDLHGVMTWGWPERGGSSWVDCRRAAQPGSPAVPAEGFRSA